MTDEPTPVLDTLTAMTAASIDNCNLEAREHMMVRIAALVAADAPAAAYLLNAETAAGAGVTLEDVQGILIAVAPIVGTPCVATAVANIAEGLGFDLGG